MTQGDVNPTKAVSGNKMNVDEKRRNTDAGGDASGKVRKSDKEEEEEWEGWGDQPPENGGRGPSDEPTTVVKPTSPPSAPAGVKVKPK